MPEREGSVTAQPDREDLARAILSLADSASMPDSVWQTDGRVTLAREVLGVPDDGRFSHAHLWSASDNE